MGLLSVGTPLEWKDAKAYCEHVRNNGIEQFVNIFNRLKGRKEDILLWGDEIEYIVVHLDKDKKKARLSLNAYDTLEKLQLLETEALQSGKPFQSSWKPEYGRYMLEGTPQLPFGATLADLVLVEENMAKRRSIAQSLLGPNELLVTMTSFPHLGVHNSLHPHYLPTPAVVSSSSQSLFIPDAAINPHARFSTLTANIKKRRGSKVAINLPIYKDINTPHPFMEKLPESVEGLSIEELTVIHEWSNSSATPATPLTTYPALLKELVPDALDNHIYLDCMCFGMGCSCLQITFQACSIEEGRKLYDHLAVMAPIMLALSAAAPIFRGYLTDRDCRWDVISGSVDDRTKEERGLLPLMNEKHVIAKSRYDSISLYLSPGPLTSGGCCGTKVEINENGVSEERTVGDFYKDKYNDLDLAIDEKVYQKLREEGVDHLLSKHYAHLFIRDPLVIFEELLDQNNIKSSDHFENIQSTNWQTMRFKPPPPSMPSIGWRVEFRSMEVQKTDFENASFSVFIVLLTRTILNLGLNLYIPLSKVDDNMNTAQKRDAVLEERFWFRNYINNEHSRDEDSFTKMTVNEIMNGSSEFIGLIPLIHKYLLQSNVEPSIYEKLIVYLKEISNRANGSKRTNAREMRDFVKGHAAYNGDSIVNDEIVYDMCQMFK